MPTFINTALDGVIEVFPEKYPDERGFFSDCYSQAEYAAAGIDCDFVQDNHSYSRKQGVLRGLHFQVPPCAQDKLVRVVRGAVLDIAVDIRRNSSTFGHWIGVEISASKWNQLFIPVGFAHGFVTLESDTEVLYKVSTPSSPKHERSIRFDDPDIAIDWQTDFSDITLSPRDRNAGSLNTVSTGF